MALSQKEDPDAEEETPSRRDRREATPGGRSDVARTERCRCGALDWSYRGHLLSVAAEYGGLKSDQVKRLKALETENGRLRKAISDLTLDKLILQEAARGNF